ncbi:MAG: SagB/ThcOx family dehydrogenase, partial [Chloroflexota bacterium]
RFRAEAMTLPELSQVLWAAQGVTSARHGLRTVPSAGATYPLEAFVLVGKHTVDELEAGVYRYDPQANSLGLHREGDLRMELATAALDQSFAARAPACIVICAVYQRTCFRYDRRGERYVHMEAGHAAQNIHLAAVALKLGTVVIGAFDDDEVQKTLGLESQLKPLCLMPLGKPV